MGVFPRSLQQPGLGDCYAGLGETVAEIDNKRAAVLALLRDTRALKDRTTDPALRERLRQAEEEAVMVLGLLAQAANYKDQPGWIVAAINGADSAVRAMGSAIREVTIAIAETAGSAVGGATKPVVDAAGFALIPIAVGLVAVAFIMGGGIKTGKK